MKDLVVIQQLKKQGIVPDDMLKLKYEAIERMPRILDDKPPKLTLTKIKDPVACGIAAQFKDTYSKELGTCNTDVFYIDILDKRKIQLDEKVFYLLKTLIIMNISYSEDLTNACADLFKSIVLCGEDVVTEKCAYSVITKVTPTTYAQKVLLKTIIDVCFGDDGTVLLWRSMAESDGYYKYAINRVAEYIQTNNINDKELKKLINDNYKLAKADSDFMGKLIKGIPTKALTAMIYIFREEPEMFNAGEQSGFM